MPDFGGDSGGNSTSVQTTSPPSFQLPYLQDVLTQAKSLYQGGQLSTPFPTFQTTADFTPEQLQAQSMGVARATNGSPLNAASSNYLTGVLNGNFLNSNPYTQQLANRTGSMITDQLSRAGRYGANNATTRGLAEGLAPVLNQNYQTERGFQQSAAGLAPTLANQDYVDISALNDIGSQRQNQIQALLNEAVQRYTQNQQAPQQALKNYAGLVTGNLGNTTTTQAPNTSPSSTQQGIGTGLAALGTLAQLYGAFGK